MRGTAAGPQGFAKGLESCAQLALALRRTVRLNLDHGNLVLLRKGPVFEAIVVAELHGVVDHALLATLAHKLAPLGNVIHAHAGNLAEKRRCVPVEKSVEGVGRGGCTAIAAHAAGRTRSHPRELGRGRDLEVPARAGGVLHRHARALLHLGDKRCGGVRTHERHAVVRARHARPAGGACRAHVELRSTVCGVGVCERPQTATEERNLRGPAPVRQVKQVEEVHTARGLQHVVDAAYHIAAGHHALDEALAVAAEVGMSQRVGVRKGGNVRLGDAWCGSKSRKELDGRVLARVEEFVMFLLFSCHVSQLPCASRPSRGRPRTSWTSGPPCSWHGRRRRHRVPARASLPPRAAGG